MHVLTAQYSGTNYDMSCLAVDQNSVLGGKVGRCGVVPRITMNEPAMLYRKMGDTTHPGRRSWETVIARGPFIVMAAGYLAFDPELRASFSIRSETREVTPEEIEEAVREWNSHKQDLTPGT